MSEIKTLLIKEVRRRLMEEGETRIKKCLAELTPQEIWYRPNDNSNSVGNLVLHLCGNVRQWIVTGLGGRPDARNRPAEFAEKGPLPTAYLIEQLESALRAVDEVLDEITDEQLTAPVTIQGFDETGLTVLVHVVEHFSYHVGQIAYYVKWRKDMDIGFYGGMELNDFGAASN